MSTWKIVLATVVIFGAGVLTGGLLVSHARRADARQMRRITTALEAWRPRAAELVRAGREDARALLDQRRFDFIRTIHRQLKLTPEQRARIEQIVREGQEKTREIMESIQPQLREHWAEVNRKIRAELTPAQRKQLDRLLKHRPWAQVPPPPALAPAPRNGPHKFAPPDEPPHARPDMPRPPSEPMP
ncbi:MAG: hypothetical protein NZ739_00895 [Verrucomicrobiae bacterium]|nr:hypothetical protein [Verrucomicrobiae bacterium]MCX7721887.1 hypothetical protein [Verrucomicrobiae bacterium]